MGLLDDIIDGASSDTITTTNLLRKVKTVAHRVGAHDLSEWVRSELDGYDADAPLPTYRGPFDASVQGLWSGPMGASARLPVSSIGVPDDMRPLFVLIFRQGVAEIEQLAARDSELSSPWDPYAVGRYNELIDRGIVPRMEWMGLANASRVVTPALLRGIVDAARTKALDLALDLQAANPAAGEVGGPTQQDPAVASAVITNINHIYGDVANVAQGTGITQTATVSKGDVIGLAQALASFLPESKSVGEAMAIITSDAPAREKRSKLRTLGKAIGGSTAAIAVGVTSDVAAAGLIHLASQYLGW